jgi:hypothetical protein
VLPDGSSTKCRYLAITAAAEGSAFTGTSVLVPAHTEDRHFFGRDFLKKIEGRVFENEFSIFFFFSEIKIFGTWCILGGEFFEKSSSNFLFEIILKYARHLILNDIFTAVPCLF